MTVEFSTTTVAPLSGSEIQGSFILGQDFNQTVGVSITSQGTDTFTIQSITAVLIGEQDPIEVATDTSSITIEGSYLSGFEDLLTYVPPGESDRTTDPITAVGFNNLPGGQNLYNLDQDQKQFIFREYDVTVVYTNDTTLEETTENVVLTHEVLNDLEAVRSFMSNYDYGEG
jgi:hypothetical protein